MSTSTEFNGFDFAAGDMRGMRLWNPVVVEYEDPNQPDGIMLKSVYRDYLWSPGVNEAHCQPVSRGGMAPPTESLRTTECLTQHHHSEDWPYTQGNPECHRPHHEGIDSACSCGFYAYTRGQEENPYLRSDKGLHVQGIIKGYGRTVIGTKGFRCTKAEILALVLPCHISDKVSSAQREAADRVNELLPEQYPSIPVFPTMHDAQHAFPLTDGGILTRGAITQQPHPEV